MKQLSREFSLPAFTAVCICMLSYSVKERITYLVHKANYLAICVWYHGLICTSRHYLAKGKCPFWVSTVDNCQLHFSPYHFHPYSHVCGKSGCSVDACVVTIPMIFPCILFCNYEGN